MSFVVGFFIIIYFNCVLVVFKTITSNVLHTDIQQPISPQPIMLKLRFNAKEIYVLCCLFTHITYGSFSITLDDESYM